jgi:hypothetical protein
MLHGLLWVLCASGISRDDVCERERERERQHVASFQHEFQELLLIREFHAWKTPKQGLLPSLNARGGRAAVVVDVPNNLDPLRGGGGGGLCPTALCAPMAAASTEPLADGAAVIGEPRISRAPPRQPLTRTRT